MERATLSDILREVKHAPELQDRLARIVYNLGGGRVPFVFTSTPLGALVNAVETPIMTTPPLNPGIDQSNVLVLANQTITATGATTTTLLSRIRQGTTITGTQVGPTFSFTIAAAAAIQVFNMALDTPGAVAGLQYTMTGTQTGGSSNSTMGAGIMLALALG